MVLSHTLLTNMWKVRKEVAGMRVGSVGIVRDANQKLNEEPAHPSVVACRLVQACNLVFLVHASRVPATRGKVRVLFLGSSGSGWACGPSRQWRTDLPAPEFVLALFVQPLARFLGVVLAAWHDGAHSQDSKFILQQVESMTEFYK